MDQHTQAAILLEADHKVGMIETFFSEIEGADELIELYKTYEKERLVSTIEIKAFLGDLNLFLESIERCPCCSAPIKH